MDRPPAARTRFPTTRGSLFVAARSDDAERRRRGLDAIAAGYWEPARAYVRFRWRVDDDDARDLVQGFFAQAVESDWLQRWDPARARFRTWVRVGLDGWVANELKRRSRIKRGGGVEHVALDGVADDVPAAGVHDPDEVFHREWVRHLFERAVADLAERSRERGWAHHLALFERYDLADPDARPTYATLAAERGIAVTDVTNHLAAARREFRRAVLARLRELTGDDDEYRHEARLLLGVDAP